MRNTWQNRERVALTSVAKICTNKFGTSLPKTVRTLNHNCAELASVATGQNLLSHSMIRSSQPPIEPLRKCGTKASSTEAKDWLISAHSMELRFQTLR